MLFRRWYAVLVLAALAPLAPPPAAARAAGVALASAAAYQFVPGGEGTAVPLRIQEGSTLLFAHADVLGCHTLTAQALDDSGRPLFETPDQVCSGQVVEVMGAGRLPPGRYRFFCVPHFPVMWGTLEVRSSLP